MAVHDIRRNQGEAEADQRSFRGLLSELVAEFTTLFRQEIALAKAETGESIAHAKNGAIAAVAGSLLALVGLGVLLMAAVYGLSEVMHPGWAALIVGGVTVLIGLIALKTGLNQLKARNMVPRRSAESLRRDAEVAVRRG